MDPGLLPRAGLHLNLYVSHAEQALRQDASLPAPRPGPSGARLPAASSGSQTGVFEHPRFDPHSPSFTKCSLSTVSEVV